MKRLILLITILFSVFSSAQILEPVTWEFDSKKINDSEYELIFKATIDDTWSIYSMTVEEGGPIPTSISFEESDNYSFNGELIESDINRKTGHDVVFDMTVSKITKEALYTQRVKIKSDQARITGSVLFQACDYSKCLMPTDVPFEFKFSDGKLSLVGANTTDAVDLNANAKNNMMLYGMQPEDIITSNRNCNSDGRNIASEVKENNSLWKIFGLGFLGGLIALLTPCVFPMIPLTVSFFTKKGDQSKSKGLSKAFLYGFFILAVYLVLSIPFHLLDSVNPDILNEISTNVILNIIFFIIFVFFAFSFFGYYELTLPASWTNKTTQGENIGGMLGVFFMALTLAIVSFSCTGPILGSLLAGSLTADGGAWQLTAGMGGFGLALGLPFALFAAFPSWLNSLPKSGGWLNTTKVVLGFLELALAFKFLSNSDLVKQWGLLKIEVFLVIWIIIFIGLALYLLGKLKFPHDSPLKKLSFFRIATGVLVVAFVIYLGSGFRVNKETNTYHSLKLLSGLAPPVGYSWLYPNDCPNNLNCFKDFKEGVAYAQKVNKPILIDFTGYACVNCRKMEEHIWPEEKVKKFLEEDYVLISLYVDDKRELPEHEKVEVNRINGGTRLLENYGHKWANFETQFFQQNSQPYYILLNPDGKTMLNQPVPNTPDVDKYAAFLQCGVELFKEKEKSSIFN